MSIADHELERLNKLCLPADRLSSSLSTFSYAFYLLACLNARGRPIKDNLRAFIEGDLLAIVDNNQELIQTSSLASFGAMLYEARSILRLFRIIPRITELRRAFTSNEKDRCLWITRLLESAIFTIHQGVENAAILVDYKVVPRRMLDRAKTAGPFALYTLAYRIWAVGLACTMFRLLREMQLWLKKGTSNDHHKLEKERPSSAHLLLLCWLPVQWTLSGWTEHEVPGLHIILHSIGDSFAEARHHTKIWSSLEGTEKKSIH